MSPGTGPGATPPRSGGPGDTGPTPGAAHREDSPTPSGGLGRKAGILALSRMVPVGAQLVSAVVVARMLTKEENAALITVLAAYNAVLSLAQLGLPESVFYFFERVERDARKTLVLTTARTLLLLGLGAAGILVLLDALPIWRVDVGGLFLLLIPLVLLELPTLPVPNALIAIDRTPQAASINVAAGILQFLAVVGPALAGWSVRAIVVSLVGYGAIRLLLSAFLFLRHFPGATAPLPPGTSKEQLTYSAPLSLAQALWSVNRQIDKFIVAAFLPAALVAEYGFGAHEVPFVPIVAYSVGAVMMPDLVSLFADGRLDELRSLWLRSIRRVTMVVVPLAMLVEVVADEVVVLMFTERYAGAALPLRIYTLVLLHRVASYSSMLKATGDTPTITRSAVYLVATNVALSIPLVIWLGMAGPPLGMLLANLAVWVWILHEIAGSLGTRISRVFPFDHYVATLVVATAAGAVAYGSVEAFGPDGTAALPLKAGVFLAVHVTLGATTGLLTGTDLRALLAVFRKSRR